MIETEFIEKVLQDTQLRDFLQAVATETQEDTTLDIPQTYTVGGADVLMFLAACTLYRWAKETLDQRRQRHQNQILAERAAIVSSLIEKGLSAKDSQAVVTALLKNIEALPAEDPVVKKVLNLLH